MLLEILFQDGSLVAINKPHGLLVHRSSIAKDVTEFALQLLRDQLNRMVFPVHRLDRKTSGVLLFALDEEMNKKLQNAFASREIKKKYLAIVRGYTSDEGIIDYPLKKKNGTLQEAITHYKTLQRTELEIPFGKHNTVRYSLVEISPETGRMHQIRKHFAHIFHPIIGDRPYGCNKQNKFFKERWSMDTMLLHASSLTLMHPSNSTEITIMASVMKEFRQAAECMGFIINK